MLDPMRILDVDNCYLTLQASGFDIAPKFGMQWGKYLHDEKKINRPVSIRLRLLSLLARSVCSLLRRPYVETVHQIGSRHCTILSPKLLDIVRVTWSNSFCGTPILSINGIMNLSMNALLSGGSVPSEDGLSNTFTSGTPPPTLPWGLEYSFFAAANIAFVVSKSNTWGTTTLSPSLQLSMLLWTFAFLLLIFNL